jgi:hypothetical protein
MGNDIQVALIPGKNLKFRLLRDLCFTIGGERVCVPEGFVSDGASVPRWFWRMLPPFGLYLRAAILHDWLYRSGWCSKREADRLLWIIAKRDGTPLWQRLLIRTGLAIGGGFTWRKYARMRANGIDCVTLTI